ncbi:hypothetical protein CFP65_3090 [Kitasatospora sp. MMS16-BH015]|uniref:hypothetical protein n=1 Tax=Kitasatospora sp. MMS16-BH015 TaxID=2018025 RepID=UPI000CA3A0E2|nr:hypothetical protein [Kitasatospora sp. MMS16-BH015]AUG77897.1 hypothetical protein CFP65_3090 [Kitasatospora sp. MMS16-BH015]
MTADWETATDPGEVHDLLLASDLHVAASYGLPVPQRNPHSTELLVGEGRVHLLRVDGAAAAMFALTSTPAFEVDLGIFPPAVRPAYLRRLAVRPERLADGELYGPMCVRRATEEAARSGAGALRAETNPDLAGIVRLLEAFGFRRYGPVRTEGWMRRVYLACDLGSFTR